MFAGELTENGFAVREAEDGDPASALIMENPTPHHPLVTALRRLRGQGDAHAC